jgi:NAD(P)-dependent dehydrogenase (short-subunit alcohol dehydrogenase family)
MRFSNCCLIGKRNDYLHYFHLWICKHTVDGYVSPTCTCATTNLTCEGTYGASKRSIEIVADTLRLELQPFGVDVLCVVTGAVKSLGQTYMDDLKLPEASLYKSIEKTVVSRAQGQDGLPRMDTLEYANATVDQIVARASGKFWYGQNADLVRNATTAVAVPQSAFVSSKDSRCCPQAGS